MQQLAQIGGYHPSYFGVLFKEAVGYPPKHFLILERIRFAKTLLQELDAIETVADRLGYSSVHYFSRHFKEVTGISPSEYKKRSVFL
jgi:AraC-like DNA-binding protein